ncbi:dihydrofolate reductase family protein [Georgenia alba]|uniref:Dihydrofolate reductase family protein n=1 Tax=Georgenia alba TaxID=2233858 RepID=A0ABW2Q8Q3_9MICO
MRNLIVSEFITLDGIIENPEWTYTEVKPLPEMFSLKEREQQEAGCLLLGRVSYDEFAPVWPSMEEFAEYNAMPKYVVSSSLEDPEWHNTSVLRSLEEVRELKESDDDGTILVHASATLAQGLLAAGLVDRYHLLVFPILLGGGKRLFAAEDGAPAKLALAEHETYANGVQMQVWDVVR